MVLRHKAGVWVVDEDIERLSIFRWTGHLIFERYSNKLIVAGNHWHLKAILKSLLGGVVNRDLFFCLAQDINLFTDLNLIPRLVRVVKLLIALARLVTQH